MAPNTAYQMLGLLRIPCRPPFLLIVHRSAPIAFRLLPIASIQLTHSRPSNEPRPREPARVHMESRVTSLSLPAFQVPRWEALPAVPPATHTYERASTTPFPDESHTSLDLRLPAPEDISKGRSVLTGPFTKPCKAAPKPPKLCRENNDNAEGTCQSPSERNAVLRSATERLLREEAYGRALGAPDVSERDRRVLWEGSPTVTCYSSDIIVRRSLEGVAERGEHERDMQGRDIEVRVGF
ncbi:hypothetical protein V8E36_002383 [Tilletia maclaganii]